MAVAAKRPWVHWVLLLATLLTTLYCGYEYHVRFTAPTPAEAERLSDPALVLSKPWLLIYGAPFSLTLLAILLAHEMGHYWTCRRHRIDATLPYVIPAPPFLPLPPPIGWLIGKSMDLAVPLSQVFYIPLNPFGTFGAVIRIKSAFGDRKQLFDVGVAGPLAGFAVIVPAMIAGIWLSGEFVHSETQGTLMVFGEPWAFQLAVDWFFRGGEGRDILLHPIGWAAWFGLLATSLNLLPIGQLDGGHMVYAVFGPRVHRVVSFLAFFGLVLLNLLSWPVLGYLLFALILLVLGFRHPPTYDDAAGLGRGRWIIALIGLIVFILTFIPFPIQIIESSTRI